MNLLQILRSSINAIYAKYLKNEDIDNLPIYYIGGSQTLPPPLSPEEEEETLQKIAAGQEELRLQTLMDFLSKEKEVGLLFGCAPKVMTTSVNAVKRMNLKDSVCVIGFGESEEILDGVRQGLVQCLAMQESYQMGWMGVEYLTKLCSGTEEANEIDSEIIVPFQLMTPDMFLGE